MKKLIFLCTIFATVYANGYENENYGIHETHEIVAKVKNVNTGHSAQTRKQDSYGNYAFSYNEQHHDGGSSRQEAGDSHGNKHGSYSLNVGDGRQRFVKYVADDYGFRATIKTNEPGIISQSPASIYIISPQAKNYNSYAEFSNHDVPAYVSAVPVYASSIQAYGHPTQALGHPTQAYGNPTQAYEHPVQTYGHPVQTYGHPVQNYEHSAPAYVDSSAYNYGPINKYENSGLKENHSEYNSYNKYSRSY